MHRALVAILRATFLSDLTAGVTVGLVALPLAMAFAVSSGMSPQAGIYCAVVTGFLISAFGGSNVQIGGPTGAFVVVVSGIVGTYGVDGLFMCTMMAGVILVIMGVTGTGTAVKFIPRPVVIGFTNGIALVIASTQLKDFLGSLWPARCPANSSDGSKRSPRTSATTSPGRRPPWGSASSCYRRLESTCAACARLHRGAGGGYGGRGLAGLPVETIGTRFGGIPAGLPDVNLPKFRPDLILTLLSPTLTVAMLGAIESLMSAVVADRMTGGRHNSNVELFAQGIANIVSPMVGGLPATGAIARTATNIRSGAKTPVAGMVHAMTLLAVLLFAAPLAASVPLAVLAGILLIVARNMGEWHEIPELWKQGWTDRLVWMVTFVLTVVADLTVAVEAGMILAALLFIRRVATTTTVSRVTDEYVAGRPRAHAAGQGDPGLRGHLPHPRPVPVRGHGQARERDRGGRRAAADRDPPAAQHDGHRRHRLAGDPGRRRRAAASRAGTCCLCGALPQPAHLMEQAEFHRHVGRREHPARTWRRRWRVLPRSQTGQSVETTSRRMNAPESTIWSLREIVSNII